jgi:hypothetical protein
MNIIVIPPADKELEEAIDYYNDQMAGLGNQSILQFFFGYYRLSFPSA